MPNAIEQGVTPCVRTMVRGEISYGHRSLSLDLIPHDVARLVPPSLTRVTSQSQDVVRTQTSGSLEMEALFFHSQMAVGTSTYNTGVQRRTIQPGLHCMMQSTTVNAMHKYV